MSAPLTGWEPPDTPFPVWIKALCRQRGWTNEWLAGQLVCTEDALSAYKSGRNPLPADTAPILLRLAGIDPAAGGRFVAWARTSAAAHYQAHKPAQGAPADQVAVGFLPSVDALFRPYFGDPAHVLRPDHLLALLRPELAAWRTEYRARLPAIGAYERRHRLTWADRGPGILPGFRPPPSETRT